MFFLPTWFIFSILQGLTSNGFNFISRYVLRGNDDGNVYAWIMQVLRFVVFLPVAVLFDWKLIINSESLLILFLLGITELLSSFFYMKMHEHSELSISSIISRTRILWVPLFAFIILGEHLRPIDYMGIVILFLGVSIVSSPKKMFVDKGALYANAAALSVALNIVFFKLATPYASNAVMLTAFTIPSLFIFPLLMKNAKKRIMINLKQNLILKILAIVLNIISLFFFAFAIKEGDASKVNAVYQGMMVFTVLAGIIFLKERTDIQKKLIGTFVTILGVVLLSLY